MSFQISALPKSLFEDLFSLSTSELASRHALRMTATNKPGFPCRVSLADAEIGEEVLLVHYEHQTANTPFRASHAVYVRPKATEMHLQPDQIPESFRSRIFSIRAFDASGMMTSADLSEGIALEQSIAAMLEDKNVAYLHLHFAKPGCYAARVDRVD